MVRLLALLAAGIFAGLVAATVIQGMTTGRLGSIAWIALAFLALMVMAGAVALAVAVHPRRVHSLPTPRAKGDLKTVSGVVDAAGAESLRVEITLTHGRLHLAGGAHRALLAQFRYDDADWQQPFVRYVINNKGEGLLLVSQRPSVTEGPSEGQNDWLIQLNDHMPIDLAVRIGAGNGTLRLAGLTLTSLDVWPGAGELTLDLGGEWKQSLGARVHAGLGKVHVRLPKAAGVRVVPGGRPGSLVSKDGLVPADTGGLVNSAYGTSPVKLDLAIDGGLGEVTLESVE